MKKSEVQVGGVYHARISGKFVHVRVDSIGENHSGRTTFAVTNLMTGRRVTFRSAMRFRGKVIPRDIEEHPPFASHEERVNRMLLVD